MLVLFEFIFFEQNHRQEIGQTLQWERLIRNELVCVLSQTALALRACPMLGGLFEKLAAVELSLTMWLVSVSLTTIATSYSLGSRHLAKR